MGGGLVVPAAHVCWEEERVRERSLVLRSRSRPSRTNSGFGPALSFQEFGDRLLDQSRVLGIGDVTIDAGRPNRNFDVLTVPKCNSNQQSSFRTGTHEPDQLNGVIRPGQNLKERHTRATPQDFLKRGCCGNRFSGRPGVPEGEFQQLRCRASTYRQ